MASEAEEQGTILRDLAGEETMNFNKIHHLFCL